MSSIGVVIITADSAEYIDECFQSISWADEAVVVDLESTDDTVERCRKYTDKVFIQPRVPTPELVRDFGTSKADTDWVLHLDPDEHPTPELIETMKKISSSPDSADAYFIMRSNVMFGRTVRYTGWGNDEILRFFRKGKCSWPHKIHAVPDVDGEKRSIRLSEGYLLHYNYKNIHQFVDKLNRYTDMEAVRVRDNGRPFHWLKLFYQPGKEFCIRFFKLKGYKDGLVGLMLSLMMAFYWQLIYIKLWELYDREDKAKSLGL